MRCFRLKRRMEVLKVKLKPVKGGWWEGEASRRLQT